MSSTRHTQCSFLVAALVTAPLVAVASPGHVVYRGELEQDGGPAPEGAYEMTFAVFESAVAEEPLWSSPRAYPVVVDEIGHFEQTIDLFDPDDDPAARAVLVTEPEWYWEVTVRGVTLAPRQHMAAIPIAGAASDSMRLGGWSLEQVLEHPQPPPPELADILARLDSLEARHIDADLVLHVAPDPGPDQYPNVNAALAYLEGKSIVSSATVTIRVQPGDYRSNTSIRVEHPNGGRIRIVGAESSRDEVLLRFDGAHGVVVENGSRLGYIGGITLIGDRVDDDNPGTDQANGLRARSGGYMRCGNLVVRQFGSEGIHADIGSIIDCSDSLQPDDGSVVVENCRSSGVWAGHGSAIYLPGSVARGNGANGFYAHSHSFLLANNSTAEDNGVDGFGASDHSYIRANLSQAIANAEDGFQARAGSHISAGDTESLRNIGKGYTAYDASAITAPGANASGNHQAGFHASIGSTIRADERAESSSNRSTGFSASVNSTIFAKNARVRDNDADGVVSGSGSYVDARQAFCERNAGHGLYAFGSSTIQAGESTIGGNETCQVKVQHMSFVDATGATEVLGDGEQLYCPDSVWDPDAGQSDWSIVKAP